MKNARSAAIAAALALVSPTSALAGSAYEITATILSRTVTQPDHPPFGGELTIAPGIWEAGQTIRLRITAPGDPFGIYGCVDFACPGTTTVSLSSPGFSVTEQLPDLGFAYPQRLTVDASGNELGVYVALEDIDQISTRYTMSNQPGASLGYTAPHEIMNIPSPEDYFITFITDFDLPTPPSVDGALGVPPGGLTSSWSYLRVYDEDAGSDIEFEISQATIVPVPEPASWALMLTGLFGMGQALRRRRTMVAA